MHRQHWMYGLEAWRDSEGACFWAQVRKRLEQMWFEDGYWKGDEDIP